MNRLLRQRLRSLLFCLAAGSVVACVQAPTSQQFPRPFHIIAHRGASALAPENSLPAFLIAREQGAFEVELDVQLTRDDVVMLFHDATLDEKTRLTGSVRVYTAAELRETDIGVPRPIATPAGEFVVLVAADTVDGVSEPRHGSLFSWLPGSEFAEGTERRQRAAARNHHTGRRGRKAFPAAACAASQDVTDGSNG